MVLNSRRMLLAALFTVLLIAAVNLAWWLFYDRTAQLLDQQLSRRLLAIARTTAAGLDQPTMDLLAAGDFDAYTTTVTILERALEADSLSELFVLDAGYRYLATTSLDSDSLYFLAALNGVYIDSIFFEDSPQALATPSYRTGQLYLKSAFAPLFGSDGAVVAVVGVEANVDYFESLDDLRRNLYYSTGLSLAGGLLFGLLFLWLQRRVGNLQERLVMNETLAYLGRMTAVVAHEVRNPLMIIRAAAERLRRKDHSDESSYIIEEVDRLNSLVSGYLDLARGDSRFVESHAEEINLASFVAGIKKHLEDKLGSAQIQWQDDPIPEGLSVSTNAGALRQVLLNLLLNGAEACQAAVRPVKLGITVTSASNGVAIVVSDWGPGIPKSALNQVFDPFYTTKQSGSGLGLFLSRKIVVQMGGSIDIESSPDKGTTVTISLPTRKT